PGLVRDHVRAAETLRGGLEQVVGDSALRNIAGDQYSLAADSLDLVDDITCLLRHIVDHDARTRTGQLQSFCPAETGARSGHDRGQSVQAGTSQSGTSMALGARAERALVVQATH